MQRTIREREKDMEDGWSEGDDVATAVSAPPYYRNGSILLPLR